MTKTIEEHIDVDVPVQSAYNQWTQFESFPDFKVELKRFKKFIESRHGEETGSYRGEISN